MDRGPRIIWFLQITIPSINADEPIPFGMQMMLFFLWVFRGRGKSLRERRVGHKRYRLTTNISCLHLCKIYIGMRGSIINNQRPYDSKEPCPTVSDIHPIRWEDVGTSQPETCVRPTPPIHLRVYPQAGSAAILLRRRRHRRRKPREENRKVIVNGLMR